MTTREEFEEMVRQFGAMAVNAGRPYYEDGGVSLGLVHPLDAMGKDKAHDAVLAAWDAQAAEVERLRAEATGVPLTAENAPRARVVECEDDGTLWARGSGNYWYNAGDPDVMNPSVLITRGATVLAWRKP